ncbi:MAG TPA: hypothetical protein DCE42_22795 [Myxococcales bacterium]|nr:hypothetical protein [Deltaproteobacteria bacterium]MBU52965.1 hypothetical protein [Deltaproteobacteria bacterium]HAA57613.1 hypothetical protein [Myxococcales bacterium]|tara:strand:- start:4 stop:465 length:462 start_codon:yes stop_codon:yes gene_type:complete
MIDERKARDGESKHIDADLVLVGIGMLPNAELASEAGLAVTNGIVVDEDTRTSDPAIFAIGDCTNQRHPYVSQRIRLESVPNAIEQAKIAASVMMGLPLPKRTVPWFWSEQYGLKLQMVGLSCGYERCILRRYEGTQDFVAFYRKKEAEGPAL